MVPSNAQADIRAIIEIASSASSAILDIYQTDFVVQRKEDHTLLTEADSASNRVLQDALNDLYPEVPIISEESKQIPYSVRKNWDTVWLIDPLDGTREFVKRNGEFTINVALIQHAKPIMGLVYVPVSGLAYTAALGKGAHRWKDGASEPIKCATPKDSIVIAASRSHVSRDVQKLVLSLRTRYRSIEYISAGSALKFCLIAEGRAHMYPRFGTTMEWDTAAGQILVEEAGGGVVDMINQESLMYNKEDLRNPSFSAVGSNELLT